VTSGPFNPVLDILERWVSAEPHAVALVSVGPEGQLVQAQTAAALARESRRMARAFMRLGIEKGDRVLIMMSRVPAWYTAMLGAMRMGVIAIPTPNQCTERDVNYRIESATPVAVIADEAAASRIEGAGGHHRSVRHWVAWSPGGSRRTNWRDLDALLDEVGDGETPESPTMSDDPSLIFFSSGTVAYPKMVLHSQSYTLGHVAAARYWHGVRPGDRHWTISDNGWAKAAWGSMFGQWHERATVLQANLPRPSAATILSIIREHSINSFCAPPTIYRLLVQENLGAHDLSSLRECTGAGEPLNPEVIRAWREATGITIRDGYGQTETTLLVGNTVSMPVRVGSMGKPITGYDVTIADDDGKELGPNQLGNIVVRAAPRPIGLFSEYLNNDEETRKAFRSGWYFTGDRASMDNDGYFWFSSRVDDVITSSAYRIGPFEVESALIEHPAVLEAAVVGKEDPERTEIVCAFVILANGFTESPDLAAGACQAADSAVQISTRNSFLRGSAENNQRQDTPIRIAPSPPRGEVRTKR
jgi:acetyl-CoA synthetase